MKEQNMSDHCDHEINESSLSRVYRHNILHDCGALTAWRKAEKCDKGNIYTRAQNRQRNRSLLAKLKAHGYGVTTLHGKYPEGGVTSTEESYFVVDLQDTGRMEAELRSLGQQFEQDSVLFIPKGAVEGKAKAFLIGTNHCPKNDISFGGKILFDKGRFGYNSKIYTSFVNGRPFIFEEVGDQEPLPNTGFGWWALHLAANKHWTEL
jgi:hypothetical protein